MDMIKKLLISLIPILGAYILEKVGQAKIDEIKDVADSVSETALELGMALADGKVTQEELIQSAKNLSNLARKLKALIGR